MFMAYMGDPHLESVTPAETPPAWSERHRDRMKWKKTVEPPKYYIQGAGRENPSAANTHPYL